MVHGSDPPNGADTPIKKELTLIQKYIRILTVPLIAGISALDIWLIHGKYNPKPVEKTFSWETTGGEAYQSTPYDYNLVSEPYHSAIVDGLILHAPFIHEETDYNVTPFSILEVYSVSRNELSPLEVADRVLSDILALGFSNEKEERETEIDSEDHMDSIKVYLLGQDKRIQLLVGWVESGYEVLDPNIYVMIGEYR